MNHNPRLRKAAIGFLLVMTILMLDSCKTKKFIYLEDMPVDTALTIPPKYQTRIKPGDRLSIHVSCSKQELAVPFNNVSYHVTNEGKTTASDPYAPDGYLVDEKGYINFPVVGRVKVGGLTKRECEAMIHDKIKPYLNAAENPVVTVRMSSYSISVLGEVNRPGSFQVAREKINILEALAQAGDLTIYGVRENVKLIREDAKGHKQIHQINLNDANLLTSPYYYLQQNDIVYVEPNKVKAQNSTIGQSTTLWISATSILVSVAALVVNILK